MRSFTSLFQTMFMGSTNRRAAQRNWRPRVERLETRAMLDGSDDLTVTLTFDDGGDLDIHCDEIQLVDLPYAP
jgi:hypothetical protein